MHSPPDQHELTARRGRAGASLVARGIALNSILAVAKIAGGVWGNTYALIADGIESILDIVSSVVVWAGLRVAARPPDAEHPYGHGKAEPLVGLVVALLVFAAAAWIASYAVHEILTPHRTPHWGTLPLLAGVVVLKLLFSRRLLRAEEQLGSTTLRIESWHHYADALTSAAAFVGISIAVIGGEKYASADDWAALVACLVIVVNGANFFRTAVNDVMDQAMPLAFENEVRAVAAAVAGVQAIEKCRARKSGFSHLVDLHVHVAGELSVREGHEIAGAVKHALLRSSLRITDVLVHIEPVAPPAT